MQRTKWNQNVGTQMELKFNQFGSISPKSWANWVFWGDVFHSKAKAFSGNHLVLPEVLRSFLKSEDSCCTMFLAKDVKGEWIIWAGALFLKSFLFRKTSLMPETINYESMPNVFLMNVEWSFVSSATSIWLLGHTLRGQHFLPSHHRRARWLINPLKIIK